MVLITPLTTPEMAFHTVVKAVWMPVRMPPRKVDIPPNTVFVVPSISPALPPKKEVMPFHTVSKRLLMPFQMPVKKEEIAVQTVVAVV